MSDRYPAEIQIGGLIPRTLLDELVKEIVATGTSLDDYGGRIATNESVQEVLQEGQIVKLCDDQARYGRFDELEDFLVRRGIHFNLHCDAFCEYDGENVYFRGGKRLLSLPASQKGNILIRFEDIMNILNNHDLDDHRKLEALTKLVVPPETKPLEPIRFV
jgi:hypothetical protein